MRKFQRVLTFENPTLTDVSYSVNEFNASPKVSLSGTNGLILYIGVDLPLFDLYFDMNTVNTDGATTITPKYWDGGAWRSFVDFYDGTDGLNQSGHLEFTPDRNYQWARVSNTNDELTDLSTKDIYDLYWIQLTLNTHDAGTKIGYIGHKYAEDADLGDLYPDLNGSVIKTAFESGKTSWTEQHILAADEVLSKLREKGIIKSPSQVVERVLLKKAAVHAVAELIMTSFGDDYAEQRAEARKKFKEAFLGMRDGIDSDGDGRFETVERFDYSTTVRR